MRLARCFAATLTAMSICAGFAQAELNVTVTITGDLEEIIRVLEQLKQMGVGGAKSGADREEAVRLQIHSVHEKGKTPGGILEALTPEPMPKPEPVVRLETPKVEPGAVLAGGKAIISVHAVDEARKIDTITAGMPELGFLADLADDGTRGDATPGDGVWTTEVTVPKDAAPGTYTIEFSAYGAYGAPLTFMNADGKQEPLRAEAALAVEAPEPLPEMPQAEGVQGLYYDSVPADVGLTPAEKNAEGEGAPV